MAAKKPPKHIKALLKFTKQSAGGRHRQQQRIIDAYLLHDAVKREADRLITTGKPAHAIAGILAQQEWEMLGGKTKKLTAGTIREILKEPRLEETRQTITNDDGTVSTTIEYAGDSMGVWLRPFKSPSKKGFLKKS